MHLSCLVSSCLVLSCLLLSCLVLRDSGRMFRVSLLRCLVCLARSLFVLSVVCVVLCFVCEFVCVRVCFRRRTPQNQQEDILEAAAPATPSVCLCLCSVVWFGFIVWLCGWFVCLGLLGLVRACVCWGEGKGCTRSKRVSVCTFKTFPCVPAPSPHVSYMWAWCRYTRGRFECTHGGVLNVYTGFFSRFFTVPQHTNTNTHQTHTTTTTTPRPHYTTRRQKQREKEKERQGKKARQVKREDEREERNRREKMKEKREFDSTQENSPGPDTVRIDRLKALSGAVPFLVVGVKLSG